MRNKKSTFSLSENLESWHGASPCQTELVKINIIVVYYTLLSIGSVVLYFYYVLLSFFSFPHRSNDYESKSLKTCLTEKDREPEEKREFFSLRLLCLSSNVAGRDHIIL